MIDFRVLLKSKEVKILLTLFVALLAWRFMLTLEPQGTDANLYHLKVWGAAYQIIALVGAIGGFHSARLWGGYRSVVGRAVLAFSFGLLFQVFGQTVYSYYNVVLNTDALYPSIGDIGFFGSIPFYIYGVLSLAHASGAAFSLRSWVNKLQALIIPTAMLIFSYSFFLRGYQFDWSNPIKVFLDFGYPLGQAIYVAFAILAYTLSRKFLGGIMRAPSLFILLSLIVQYICDYMFLYQSEQGTWHVGGINDHLYMISYFMMSLSLVYIGITLRKIRTRNN